MFPKALLFLLFSSFFTFSFAGNHRIKFTSQPQAAAIEKEFVTITWATNIPSVGYVHLSADGNFPAKRFPPYTGQGKSPFSSFKHTRTHQVKVTGLEQGRIYYISV